MNRSAGLRQHAHAPNLALRTADSLSPMGMAVLDRGAISTTNTISTAVASTVTLGSGGYGDSLKVTRTGSIAPTVYGADGVFAPATLSGVVVVNHGSIAGGIGIYGSTPTSVTGGIGVDILSYGLLRNSGSILGGEGSRHFGDRNEPAGNGGSGVYLNSGLLFNRGTITGGVSGAAAYASGKGGAGVVLASSGIITNHGTIVGGYASLSVGPGGAGGDGVDLLSVATLNNTGLIEGGAGAVSWGVAAAGGIGVYLALGGSVVNSGAIVGGQAGNSRYSSLQAQTSLAGVDFAGKGNLLNRGAITGGGGAPAGRDGGAGNAGDGVDMAAGGVAINKGTITGGTGGYGHPDAGIGGSGVDLSGGKLSNSGTISGGAGGGAFGGQFQQPGIAGAGGDGLDAVAATVTTTGLIEGGAGGSSHFHGMGDGNGGSGVDISLKGSLVNDGTVAGGAGGDAFLTDIAGFGGIGGIGLQIESGSTVGNNGTITGGAGGYVQDSVSIAGVGGVGVSFLSDAGTLTNTGSIAGGAGGAAYDVVTHNAGVAASGGNGVNLAGGYAVNHGTMSGGGGGFGAYQGGNGGNGVYVDGGTLMNAGTISGGAGGHGGTVDGADGMAIVFGAKAGTLIVEAGAVFHGNVAANSAVNDTLVLAGAATGTLSGFGTAITGFTTIGETAHTHWTLNGNVTAGSLAIGTGATLAVNGSIDAASIKFAAGGQETLQIGGGQITGVISGFAAGDVIDLAKLQISSLKFVGGTLSLGNDEALHFAGNYDAADFTLHADGHGGTDIAFAGAPWPDAPESEHFIGGHALAAQDLRLEIWSWLHH